MTAQNLVKKPVYNRLSWFNSVRQLKPKQVLFHCFPIQLGKELEDQKCENSWIEL